jgi:mRNA-degrading endonuclease YafQ of YafQ-DinJ toxin-antitoxin module
MVKSKDVITITLSARFIKDARRLSTREQNIASDKIELFKHCTHHEQLKVHKLHGKRADEYAFSTNHSLRVIFTWLTPSHALLHTITNHDGY